MSVQQKTEDGEYDLATDDDTQCETKMAGKSHSSLPIQAKSQYDIYFASPNTYGQEELSIENEDEEKPKILLQMSHFKRALTD